MKVSNISIIKGQTAEQSIIDAISEMFNSRASESFISCLIVDGMVGTCIQKVDNEISKAYTTTSYFIATKITNDLIRVEYCSK